MSNQNLLIHEQLNLPFPYSDYKVNYDGHIYIGVQNIADRLNDVIGIFNWTHKAVQVDIDQQRFSVSVFGRLEIWDAENERWIYREQYGDDTMTIKREATEPDAQAVENAKKSAMSDSLKKCAAWFGVAADVYAGKIRVLSKGSSLYIKAASNYRLDTAYTYKNGIPILPDSYRSYYTQQGWSGLFESDVEALVNDQQRGSSQQNQSQSNTSGSQKPSQQVRENSTSSNNSNAPITLRMRAESDLSVNQDNSSIFEALLQTQQRVKVFVPKELLTKARSMIRQGNIYEIDGWLNQRQGTFRLGKRANIVIVTAYKSA